MKTLKSAFLRRVDAVRINQLRFQQLTGTRFTCFFKPPCASDFLVDLRWVFLMMHFVSLTCKKNSDLTNEWKTHTRTQTGPHSWCISWAFVLDTNTSDMFQHHMCRVRFHVQTCTFRGRKHLLEIICSKRLRENTWFPWRNSTRANRSSMFCTAAKTKLIRFDSAARNEPKINTNTCRSRWESQRLFSASSLQDCGKYSRGFHRLQPTRVRFWASEVHWSSSQSPNSWECFGNSDTNKRLPILPMMLHRLAAVMNAWTEAHRLCGGVTEFCFQTKHPKASRCYLPLHFESLHWLLRSKRLSKDTTERLKHNSVSSEGLHTVKQQIRPRRDIIKESICTI